ncbi:MAG TPA: glycosyltransferase [Caldilineaceae bacterium]|nr:glycosyltransferase [Caldilineaceae bacterium]
MHTFVFLSTTDWDAPQFGSRQQIALRLARRGHRVLFVNVPRALHSLLSDPAAARRSLRRMGRLSPPTEMPGLDGRLLVYTPRPVLPIYYHPWTNAANQALLARDLRGALARAGWQPDILWTYWANSGRLVGRLGERLAVYHCIDDFTALRYPLAGPDAIPKLEADLCRRVDLVVARTEALAEAKRRYNPNTLYLPGGVDPALFDPARPYPQPAALASVPHPRAGFLGTLDDRIDVPLLAGCARRLPAVSFVLVGPVKRHLIDLPPLQSLPNVYFAPACAHESAPAYVAAFDVCLIPYRINRYTQGLSPLKLYEYLAMEKAVVAANLPYLAREADKIRMAADAEGFADAICAALDHPPTADERRRLRAAAASFSWDAQVDTIEAQVARLLEQRP